MSTGCPVGTVRRLITRVKDGDTAVAALPNKQPVRISLSTEDPVPSFNPDTLFVPPPLPGDEYIWVGPSVPGDPPLAGSPSTDQNIGIGDLRFLCIDTPETVHPTVPVQCFGPDASSFTKRLLSKQTVCIQDEGEDKYHRRLAHIHIPVEDVYSNSNITSAELAFLSEHYDEMHVYEGTVYVQAWLARGGYARVYKEKYTCEYTSALGLLEAAADDEKAGLWGQCNVECDDRPQRINCRFPPL